MLEKIEQTLLAPDNSVAAIVYPDKVVFPKNSYFNRISSLDVPEFLKDKYDGRRIIPKYDKQFRDVFMEEVIRRLLSQGYYWEK